MRTMKKLDKVLKRGFKTVDVNPLLVGDVNSETKKKDNWIVYTDSIGQDHYIRRDHFGQPFELRQLYDERPDLVLVQFKDACWRVPLCMTNLSKKDIKSIMG